MKNLNKFNGIEEENINWEPITITSTSISSNHLKLISDNLLKVTSNKFYQFILLFFSFAGLIIGVRSITRIEQNPKEMTAIILGALFFIFPLLIFISTLKTKKFDKKDNYFSTGFLSTKKIIHLKDIKAIQILSKRINSGDIKYDSYELNLVTKDYNRINILTQGGYKDLFIKDANLLGEFLGVPVLNGIG